MVCLSPEARRGASLHRVPPAGLHLQRDPAGHRQTAPLPVQRGPDLHLPCGPEVRLRRVSDQHHGMFNLRLTQTLLRTRLLLITAA